MLNLPVNANQKQGVPHIIREFRPSGQRDVHLRTPSLPLSA